MIGDSLVPGMRQRQDAAVGDRRRARADCPNRGGGANPRACTAGPPATSAAGGPRCSTPPLKALSQMFSPPFRTVLLKSIGLALILVVLWRSGCIACWSGSPARAKAGPRTRWARRAWPLAVLASCILTIAAGLGIIAGSVFLMPAVTALVASFFVDEIALEVERSHYPDEPVGTRAAARPRRHRRACRTALLAVAGLSRGAAVPAVRRFRRGHLLPLHRLLLGREYFELAAMRYHPAAEAQGAARRIAGTVFVAGLFIAAFVSIPIVNLATPLFGMAFMVHMHKRLSGGPAT